MTRDELLEFGKTEFARCLSVAERKNRDYTSDNPDPFFNLRRGGPFGIAVRMDDKVSRLISLLRPGAGKPQVDESVVDTARDLLNYSWLLLALIEDLRREVEECPTSTSTREKP